ncbi:MAG: hypothetical protein MZU97_24835 [Bacillus subtilis]|nr:hypothetical protein [Bacillus subtilis]
MMLCPPIIGTEKIAAKTYDILYRLNLNLIRADKKIMPPSHAAQEDVKLMYSLLQPKHVDSRDRRIPLSNRPLRTRQRIRLFGRADHLGRQRRSRHLHERRTSNSSTTRS